MTELAQSLSSFASPEVFMLHRVSNSPGRLARLRLRLRLRLMRRARSFRSDQGGAIAVIFGLCCVVLFTFIFVAVEYAGASRTDAAMQVAADGGALAAAKAAGENSSATEAELQAIVQKFVNGNLETWAENGLDVTLTKGTGELTVKVCSDYQNQTSIVSANALQEVCATAVSAIPEPTARVAADIHILVDTSKSMGLAASTTDRENLRIATLAAFKSGQLSPNDVSYDTADPAKKPTGCAFACHVVRGVKSTLEVAEDFKPPIRLRIDVSREGLIRVLQEIQTSRADVNVSMWTFYNSSIHKVVPVQPVTASFTAKAGEMKIGFPWAGGTSAETTLDLADRSTFLNSISSRAQSTGRLQYILWITDGVRATSMGSPGGTATTGENRVMDQSICDEFKSVAQVAVMYTEYMDESGDYFWDTKIKSVYPHIEGNIRNCASAPELFAKGDQPQDIINGLGSLLRSISNSAQLPTLKR